MRAPSRKLLSWTAGAALAAGGLAIAQPAPPPPAPPTAPAPIDPNAPPLALPAEEAPPADVPTPPPVAAPPVQAAEVAPAAPPKAQVVEKPVEATTKRARSDIAIVQALDKVTAESMRFEAEVGKPVRYKSLVFTVRACERSAPDEPIDDSIAYITIESQPKAAPGKPTPAARQAFRGWMYASSPGLNPLEHPAYDAWLITCRTTAPVVAAGSAPKSPSTPSARPSLR